MNIDLFTSAHSECGLLCNQAFDNMPAGLIFDAETADITVEFLEDTPLHMNVPVQEELFDPLLATKVIHIGFLIDNEITDTVSVPLYILNDPYGGEFSNVAISRPIRSILAFEQFMKRCAYAQALHRDNLGDEMDSFSILGDNDPKNLQFAAALTRQRQMELQGPQFAGPNMGPSLGPNLGPAAPGLGSAAMTPRGPGGIPSSSATSVQRTTRRRDDEE